MKIFATVIAVAICFLMFSCSIGKDIKETAKSINVAIERLDDISKGIIDESINWRDVLLELQEELDSDFSRYIDQIEGMVEEAERMALNTSTCVSQYFIESMIFELEQIRNEITGSIEPSLVDEVPVSERLILCHSFNNEVNLEGGEEELRWSIIGYWGPTGSRPSLHLNVVDRYGVPTSYDNLITYPGNNEIRVDITDLFYSNVLTGANSIEIVDSRNLRVLGEYLVRN
ncbi:MAG: hypothetical protein ACRBG0_21645 [Lewinella sp.]|uniref:hypothetical protein n=1 Tax=Lewinella sp. TaxID=2004506 RepID=UPI003D6BB2B5